MSTKNRGPTKCPHCGQRLIAARKIDGEMIRLYPMGALIFDLIAQSGSEGIDGGELFHRVYSGRERSRHTLTVQIQLIRDALVGTAYSIKCQQEPWRQWRYTVVKQDVSRET